MSDYQKRSIRLPNLKPNKTIEPSPTSSAKHSKSTYWMLTITLAIASLSLGYKVGINHGFELANTLTPVAPKQAEGHQHDSSPSNYADGSFTGP